MNKLKGILKAVQNVMDRLPIDNKLIVAGITYLLTQLVVRVGLDLNGYLIPAYLTWSQAVSLAASAVAGYLQPNEATILRKSPALHDGNPDVALLKQHGVPTHGA